MSNYPNNIKIRIIKNLGSVIKAKIEKEKEKEEGGISSE